MAEVINGYRLLAPLSNENAGSAKWGHAKKGGRDYFIKEFLDPCYPTKDSPFDEQLKTLTLRKCRAYEAEKRQLYRTINNASDGNLVRIEEFFRWDGKYYITTQWLDVAPKREGFAAGARGASNQMSIEDLYRMRQNRVKLRCVLALSHALARLHERGIAHSDIKPRNIMLTQLRTGNLSPKIVDLDSCFWVKSPPEELAGDQVYLAPESVMYMIKGEGASTISCKIDVFAMGLVFHQIFGGELPSLPEDYNFACEACLDGVKPVVSERVPKPIRGIVEDMLEADASARPSMADVHQRLWERVYGSKPTRCSPPDDGTATGSHGETSHSSRGETSHGSHEETSHGSRGETAHGSHEEKTGENRVIISTGLNAGDGEKEVGPFYRPGGL